MTRSRGILRTSGLVFTITAVGILLALGVSRRNTLHASATVMTAQQQAALRAKLAGNWLARGVPSLIGPLKVEMMLRENGSCHVNVWTTKPVEAQLRDKEGVYQLEGDHICSELLKRGSCRYWFEGDRLMMEYKQGTIVNFQKLQRS